MLTRRTPTHSNRSPECLRWPKRFIIFSPLVFSILPIYEHILFTFLYISTVLDLSRFFLIIKINNDGALCETLIYVIFIRLLYTTWTMFSVSSNLTLFLGPKLVLKADDYSQISPLWSYERQISTLRFINFIVMITGAQEHGTFTKQVLKTTNHAKWSGDWTQAYVFVIYW